MPLVFLLFELLNVNFVAHYQKAPVYNRRSNYRTIVLWHMMRIFKYYLDEKSLLYNTRMIGLVFDA